MGIRELRETLSATLKRVANGESIEVTDHDRPVARIVPLRHRGVLDQLIAEGKATPAQGSGRIWEYEPGPAEPGEPLASEVLSELRSQ